MMKVHFARSQLYIAMRDVVLELDNVVLGVDTEVKDMWVTFGIMF